MDEPIKKITPVTEEVYGVQSDSKTNEGGSILIPQIKPDETSHTQKEIPKVDKVDVEEVTKAKPKRRLNKKVLRIVSLILAPLIVTVLVIGFFAYDVYLKGLVLRESVRGLETSVDSQDLATVKSALSKTQTDLEKFDSAYSRLVWLKVIPGLGGYVSDGQHATKAGGYGLEALAILIEAIEPYSDLLGFNGGVAASGEETAQDRLDFIVKTIPDLLPKADVLSEKVSLIKTEVDQIKPDRYPEELRGFELRAKLKEGIDLVDLASTYVINGKPLLEVAPYLLGATEERQYMVLFQNDKELRPTGGFLTAYSIATLNKGKFEPVISSDIYNLDANYKPRIDAPEPLVKYLKGPYTLSEKYRLRDLNWSPDFPLSMGTFAKEAETVGIKNIDGIIAVDTQLLVYLLDVLGPIGVPGFGNFSTDVIAECNCPQVIYELESFADVEGPIVWSENEPGKIVFAPANYDNRKKIIGPLMNSILSNALGQPKEKLPLLFEAVFKSLTEKHVLVYVFDDKSQKAIEEFGIGGKISDFEGDYLHINDSNLGGRKSNLYVTQEVNQEIAVASDGSVEKTLTITYKNPEKFDGWLNSVLPNWVRIYVPKGSELVSFDGVTEKADPYEDLGKTVFAGFFELRPQGVAKLMITYKLPFKVTKDYKILLQKQPGTASPLYTLSLKKNQDEFFLKEDKTVKFGL